MTTYRESGVDAPMGDRASALAYARAQETFPSRKGSIGSAMTDAGGFAGLIDMGDFFLVQNADGTGSKMSLAVAMEKYDTIGVDLLAMVCDDAICTGAEVISVTNTLDVPRVDPAVVDALMAGHARACKEQKIIIPGGEIAEVPGATTEPVWNATSVGIVAKDRVLDPSTIKAGDSVIALRSAVARSNGFSFIRKILDDAHGEQWFQKPWKDGKTWGDIMLTPSILYHAALLTLLGRYGEERVVPIKALAHITGGGISGNVPRILKHAGVGVTLDALWDPHPALQDLVALGPALLIDAYETWNMGTGMIAIVDHADEERTITLLKKSGIQAKHAGVVTKEKRLIIRAYTGEELHFDPATGDAL
ncbi:MAG: phosphoribosylformylglycinamidine cyclo-ligase [Candidatus Peregrinibacteria bacterium]|nr:phosphoribosylformylglycinamidine cyclo-ligase [Candidatus Peregrinibacteria bacterium]